MGPTTLGFDEPIADIGDGKEDRRLVRLRADSRLRHGMVFHMKTTLDIDDSIMQRLREEAQRGGGLRCPPLSRLVSGECCPSRHPPTAPSAEPPLPCWNGGEELVDISNRDALYRVMEEE